MLKSRGNTRCLILAAKETSFLDKKKTTEIQCLVGQTKVSEERKLQQSLDAASPSFYLLHLPVLVLADVLLLILQIVSLSLQVGVGRLEFSVLHLDGFYLLH